MKSVAEIAQDLESRTTYITLNDGYAMWEAVSYGEPDYEYYLSLCGDLATNWIMEEYNVDGFTALRVFESLEDFTEIFDGFYSTEDGFLEKFEKETIEREIWG